MYPVSIFTGRYLHTGSNTAWSGDLPVRITFDNGQAVVINLPVGIYGTTHDSAALITALESAEVNSPSLARINQIEFLYDEIVQDGVQNGAPARLRIYNTANQPKITFIITGNNEDGDEIINTADFIYEPKRNESGKDPSEDTTYMRLDEPVKKSVWYQELHTENSGWHKSAINLTRGGDVTSDAPPVVGDILLFELIVTNNASEKVQRVFINDYYSPTLEPYGLSQGVPAEHLGDAVDTGGNEANVKVTSVPKTDNDIALDHVTNTPPDDDYGLLFIQLKGGPLEPGESITLTYTMRVTEKGLEGERSAITNRFDAYGYRYGPDPGSPIWIDGGHFDNNRTSTSTPPHLDFKKTLFYNNDPANIVKYANLREGDEIAFTLELEYLLDPSGNTSFLVPSFTDQVPTGFELVTGSAELYHRKAGQSQLTPISNGIKTVVSSSADPDRYVYTLETPYELGLGDLLVLRLIVRYTDPEAAIGSNNDAKVVVTSQGEVYLLDSNGEGTDHFRNKSGTEFRDAENLDGIEATTHGLRNEVDIAVLNDLYTKMGVEKRVVSGVSVTLGGTDTKDTHRLYAFDVYNYSTTDLIITGFADLLPELEDPDPFYSYPVLGYREYDLDDPTATVVDEGGSTGHGSGGGYGAVQPLNAGTVTVGSRTSVYSSHKITLKGVTAANNEGYTKLTFYVSTKIDQDAAGDWFRETGIGQNSLTISDVNRAAIYLQQDRDIITVAKGAAEPDGGDWNGNDNSDEYRYVNTASVSLNTNKIIPDIAIDAQTFFVGSGYQQFDPFVPATSMVSPGDEIGWKVTALNRNGATAAITEPTILVELPEGLDYVSGSVYTAVTNGRPTNSDRPNWFTSNEPQVFSRSDGKTVLVWTMNRNLSNNTQISFYFRTTTPAGEYRSYTSYAYQIPDSRQFFLDQDVIAANSTTTPLYQNLGSMTGESADATRTHMVRNVGMIDMFGTIGLSSVITVSDGNNSVSSTNEAPRYIAIDNPTDTFMYTYTVSNTKSNSYFNIVMVNRLPAAGDIANYGSDNRESDFRIQLADVDGIEVKKGGTTLNGSADYTIYAATIAPGAAFSRADWKQGDGAAAGDWQKLADFTDLSQITALRVVFEDHITLENGEQLSLSYPAKFGEDFRAREPKLIAWNSASTGFRFKIGTTNTEASLIMEPYPVGITSRIDPNVYTYEIEKTVEIPAGEEPLDKTFLFRLTATTDTGEKHVWYQEVTVTNESGVWKGSTGELTIDYLDLVALDCEEVTSLTTEEAGTGPWELRGSYQSVVRDDGNPAVTGTSYHWTFEAENTANADELLLIKQVLANNGDPHLLPDDTTFRFLITMDEDAGFRRFVELKLNAGESSGSVKIDVPRRTDEVTYRVTEVDAQGNPMSNDYEYVVSGDETFVPVNNVLTASITNTRKTDYLLIDKTVFLPAGETLSGGESAFFFLVVGLDDTESEVYRELHSIIVTPDSLAGSWTGSIGPIATGHLNLKYYITETDRDGNPIDSSTYRYSVNGTGLMQRLAPVDGETIWKAEVENIATDFDEEYITVRKILTEAGLNPLQTEFRFRLTGTDAAGSTIVREITVTIDPGSDKTAGGWEAQNTIAVPSGYSWTMEEIDADLYQTNITGPVISHEYKDGTRHTSCSFTAENTVSYEKLILNKVLRNGADLPENKTFTFDVTGYIGNDEVYKDVLSVVVGDPDSSGDRRGGIEEILPVTGIERFEVTEQNAENYNVIFSEQSVIGVDEKGQKTITFTAVNAQKDKEPEPDQSMNLVIHKVLQHDTAQPTDTVFTFRVIRRNDGDETIFGQYNITVARDGARWTGSITISDLDSNFDWSVTELIGREHLNGSYSTTYSFHTTHIDGVPTLVYDFTNVPGSSPGGSGGSGGSGDDYSGPSFPGTTTPGNTIEIDDEDVPLAQPDTVTILDEDVPLAGLPQTGMAGKPALALMMLGVSGCLVSVLGSRKRTMRKKQ